MTRPIGFIGVGTMGSHMTRNLLKQHYPVTVFDLNREATEELREFGAEVADSASTCASAGEVVITMLPSSPHVEAAVLGSGGAVEGMEAGSILIDMSTIDPLVSRSVNRAATERGIRMLDAPVSGGSVGARDATLTIMVGGPADLFEECKPILEAMGRNVIHCGDAGMGEVVKVVNNLIAGVSMAVVAEAFNIGVQAGADPQMMYDVVSKSSGDCWALRHNLPYSGIVPNAAVNNDYAPGFMVDLMQKDLGLAMSAAKGLKAPAFLAATAHELFGSASNLGYGRQDMSAIRKAIESLTGDAPS